MNEGHVLAIITDALESTLGARVDITTETDLVQSQILDSLDFVRFIHHVERCIEIRISTMDLAEPEMTRVGFLATYLQSRL